MDEKPLNQLIIPVIIDHMDLFVEQLRLSGYKIGIETIQQIHALLFRLSEQGALPITTQKLCTYLSAMICTSRREQQDFKSRFEKWIQTLACSINSSTQSEVSKHEKKPKFYGWLFLCCLLCSAFIFGWLIFVENQKSDPQTISTTVKPDTTEINPSEIQIIQLSPLPQVTIQWQNRQIDNLMPYIYYVLILLMLWGIWLLCWRLAARIYLRRNRTDAQVVNQFFYPEAIPHKLFGSLMMLRTARKFRRHIQCPSNRLDPKATVQKTCINGGMFTPQYEMIHITPEYLVLIDQTIFDDHQARWVDALLDRLEANDVYLERYYFSEVPGLFYPQQKGKHKRPVSIEYLTAHYPDHRLIIFSDAEFFVHPISGQLAPWMKQFNNWPVRTMFIPGTEQEIMFRKQALERSDFIVMPANERGIAALIEKFHEPNSKNHAFEDDPNYPVI
ncbi:conserved hypothetical protein, membrane, partial [Candidatus Magnetomorum sp. HK-1]